MPGIPVLLAAVSCLSDRMTRLSHERLADPVDH
jgi:hypothetical protein